MSTRTALQRRKKTTQDGSSRSKESHFLRAAADAAWMRVFLGVCSTTSEHFPRTRPFPDPAASIKPMSRVSRLSTNYSKQRLRRHIGQNKCNECHQMLPAAVQEAARKRCLPAGRRTASNPAPRLPLAQDSAHPGRPNCRRTGKRQRQTCLCNATSDDQYQPDQIGVLRNHPEQVGLRLRCSSRHVACPSARCCLCPRHCLFHATAVSAVGVIVSSTAVSLSPCGVRVCVCVSKRARTLLVVSRMPHSTCNCTGKCACVYTSSVSTAAQ